MMQMILIRKNKEKTEKKIIDMEVEYKKSVELGTSTKDFELGCLMMESQEGQFELNGTERATRTMINLLSMSLFEELENWRKKTLLAAAMAITNEDSEIHATMKMHMDKLDKLTNKEN